MSKPAPDRAWSRRRFISRDVMSTRESVNVVKREEENSDCAGLYRGAPPPLQSCQLSLTQDFLSTLDPIHRVTQCDYHPRRSWSDITRWTKQRREREFPFLFVLLSPSVRKTKLTGGGDDVKSVRGDGASRAHLPLVLLLLSHCRGFVLRVKTKKGR